ncbi:MAG: hypothetical protein WDM79_11545 [Terricaulis sp.]
MAHTRSLSLASLVLVAAATGCAGSRPPAELAGLWSSGPAACAAGVGVRFESGAIDAVYERQREVLFEHPTYQVESAGEDFRVRIRYELPRRPGGVRVAGAYGVLVLERGEEGALRPASHNMIDGRTGSARMRIVADPALTALALTPCGGHPWREELRGRGI